MRGKLIPHDGAGDLSGTKFDAEADFDVRSAIAPTPSKIDEKLTFRSENFADFFFRRGKIENCKSSKTRVAEVTRRSELSLRGKRTFEVRRRRRRHPQ